MDNILSVASLAFIAGLIFGLFLSKRVPESEEAEPEEADWWKTGRRPPWEGP